MNELDINEIIDRAEAGVYQDNNGIALMRIDLEELVAVVGSSARRANGQLRMELDKCLDETSHMDALLDKITQK